MEIEAMHSRRKIGRYLLVVAGLGLVGLLVVLSVVIVVSRALPVHTFGVGEETALGLVDPHLEIRVTEAQRSRDAEGDVVHFVTLELRSSAKKMVLEPGAMNVVVFDAAGARFEPRELRHVASGTWQYPALQPGESTQEAFEFHLPPDVEAPQLWITRKTFLSRILPGRERSRFQPKLVFALETADR